nr:MAG TPA: hypothetical protein [Caudoviricetes sp.]
MIVSSKNAINSNRYAAALRYKEGKFNTPFQP